MKTAVLIPCYNEALTIADVVRDFKSKLPEADIYVYDNCSDDNTGEIARRAGAIVRKARGRGKGRVVRQMFSDIDADVYVMVDGDSTYDASDVKQMINLLSSENVDMVVAVRQEKSAQAYREYHKLGNWLFNFIIKVLFKGTFTDVFSGYRAFSKRFVKTFPVMSDGFEIEAELSIHALTLSIPFAEIYSDYKERPKNSFSKLETFKDGFKILFRILRLLKETRPLFFFGIISLMFFLISVGLALPIILTFLETGLVPRFPTAILSTGIMMISFLSLTCGVILDSICQARMELKKLHYLQNK